MYFWPQHQSNDQSNNCHCTQSTNDQLPQWPLMHLFWELLGYSLGKNCRDGLTFGNCWIVVNCGCNTDSLGTLPISIAAIRFTWHLLDWQLLCGNCVVCNLTDSLGNQFTTDFHCRACFRTSNARCTCRSYSASKLCTVRMERPTAVVAIDLHRKGLSFRSQWIHVGTKRNKILTGVCIDPFPAISCDPLDALRPRV